MLGRLHARPSGPPTPLARVALTSLTVEQPHAIFDLGADVVARGGGLDESVQTGFRYPVTSGGSPTAAAEVHTSREGTAQLVANVNFGPFVAATVAAFEDLPQLEAVRAGSFEARVLRIASVSVLAIWLRADESHAASDLVYVLDPAPTGVRARHLYSASDFLDAIRPIANQRIGSSGPATP
jgi:hypothetical protein